MDKKVILIAGVSLLIVVVIIVFLMTNANKTVTTPSVPTTPSTVTTPSVPTTPSTVTTPSVTPSTTTTPSTTATSSTTTTPSTSATPSTTTTPSTTSSTPSTTVPSKDVLTLAPINNQPLIHSPASTPIILVKPTLPDNITSTTIKEYPPPIILVKPTLPDNITSTTIKEYPPPSTSMNWVIDTSNTIIGLRGITYNKKKYSLLNNSYGTGDYIAWANTMADNNTYAVQGLFDKNINWVYSSNAGWHTGWGDAYNNTEDSLTPAEVYIKLPNPILLSSYEIYPRGDGGVLAQTQGPIKWNLYGSNDNITYTLLHSQNNITGWTNLQSKTFDVSTTIKYNHFKWQFLRAGSANVQIVLNEIKLYGRE